MKLPFVIPSHIIDMLFSLDWELTTLGMRTISSYGWSDDELLMALHDYFYARFGNVRIISRGEYGGKFIGISSSHPSDPPDPTRHFTAVVETAIGTYLEIERFSSKTSFYINYIYDMIWDFRLRSTIIIRHLT